MAMGGDKTGEWTPEEMERLQEKLWRLVNSMITHSKVL